MGDEKEENNNDTSDNQVRREIEERSHLQLNRRDSKSSIQLSDIVPERSRQERLADPTPGSRQSTRIKDKTTTSANVICSASTTPSVSKSHIHIVTVLANLKAGYDDSGPDEPLSLKESMAPPYWKNFEKDIYTEFQSLIENDTWKYKNVASGRAILTSHWLFKIKKDR